MIGIGAITRLAAVGTAVGSRLAAVGAVGTTMVGRRLAPPLPTVQTSFVDHAKSELQATHPVATRPVRLLLKIAAWLLRRRRSSGSGSSSPSRQHSAFHSLIVTEG